MCSRGNVQSGKYPLGEMSSRGSSHSGKCLVGEMSSQGSVGRENVQLGKCPDSDFSSLKIVQIVPLSHNIFWAWAMLSLRVFNIGIRRKIKPKHYFLWQFFLIWKWQNFGLQIIYVKSVNQNYLDMHEFWTKSILVVSYLYLLLNMSHYRSIANLFRTVLFDVFWRLSKLLFFWRKDFQNLLIHIFFNRKNSNFHNSGMVGHRKLDLSMNNIFNVLSVGLHYTLSFKWPNFDLKCLVTVMP